MRSQRFGIEMEMTGITSAQEMSPGMQQRKNSHGLQTHGFVRTLWHISM